MRLWICEKRDQAKNTVLDGYTLQNRRYTVVYEFALRQLMIVTDGPAKFRPLVPVIFPDRSLHSVNEYLAIFNRQDVVLCMGGDTSAVAICSCSCQLS